jgi:lipopolysaccharide/colanic/teichoic acid biosynthesis glycosyltransferase
MLDTSNLFPDTPTQPDALIKDHANLKTPQFFFIWKRVFDLSGAIFLLPITLIVGVILVFANRRLNPGPLFYVQKRMGKNCEPFQALKFRTMLCASEIERGAYDDLEHHRITSLGKFLRRIRLDELPQIINVLRGDMSLIGPRPDFYDHALVYIDTVQGYRERHIARPGITGYAQVRHGYVQGIEGVRSKVCADLQYILMASILVDLKITVQTIKVIFGRQGM